MIVHLDRVEQATAGPGEHRHVGKDDDLVAESEIDYDG